MKGIVHKGKIIVPKLDIDIVNGADHGMWWDPATTPKNCRARTRAHMAGVIHHQAGEGNASSCFNVLNKREALSPGKFYYLSVHFQVDQKGIITQLADLDTVCQHAGDVNEWTWGVEISNRGTGKAGGKWPRQPYVDTMHGTSVTFLAFYQDQRDAVLKLVRAVHEVLGMGTSIPSEGNKAIRRVATPDEMKRADVLAHYMITDNKIDPCPDMMDYLVANLP